MDFDGIFETLREMDFASKQLKPDAPSHPLFHGHSATADLKCICSPWSG